MYDPALLYFVELGDSKEGSALCFNWGSAAVTISVCTGTNFPVGSWTSTCNTVVTQVNSNLSLTFLSRSHSLSLSLTPNMWPSIGHFASSFQDFKRLL